MLNCVEARNFPFKELSLFARPSEAGETVDFMGKSYTLQEVTDSSFDDLDIALFSGGEDVSLRFAPVAAKNNCVVVDNSSAFRMDPTTPLVIPEVNAGDAANHNGIIANPNCSTIIM